MPVTRLSVVVSVDWFATQWAVWTVWTDRMQTVNAGHTVGGGVWTDRMQTGNAGAVVCGRIVCRP